MHKKQNNNVRANMLKRRGPFHCFCVRYGIRYLDVWGIVSFLIISLTITDLIQLYSLDSKNPGVTNEEIPFSQYLETLNYTTEKRELILNEDLYAPPPLLPEFENYNAELKLALHDVYNRSFKDIAKCK